MQTTKLCVEIIVAMTAHAAQHKLQKRLCIYLNCHRSN